MSYSLNFWIATWKKKYSALNDSKHSLNSICYEFIPEEIFDLLSSFPNI